MGIRSNCQPPVNAADRVSTTVGQSPISRFELREGTSDLVLWFANNARIEFLNLSCGYEGWRTLHGQHEVICVGGGGFTELVAFDGRIVSLWK